MRPAIPPKQILLDVFLSRMPLLIIRVPEFFESEIPHSVEPEMPPMANAVKFATRSAVMAPVLVSDDNGDSESI